MIIKGNNYRHTDYGYFCSTFHIISSIQVTLFSYIFPLYFQVTAGKSRVLFVGITCGLSAPYVGGQLQYCMDHLDVFTPVVLGFNPTHLAR